MGLHIRSLRNRLAIVFGLIVLGAIGIVYFYVVPRLESALREQKLGRLEQTATRYSRSLQEAVGTDLPKDVVDSRARSAAGRTSARITLLGRFAGTQSQQLFFYSDSADNNPSPAARATSLADTQSVALEALNRRRTATATEPTAQGRLAQAARPLFGDRREVQYVAVFSEDLGDVQQNVAFIRRQILIAGVIALAIAVLAGYLVARWLTGRIARLERAARKVAAGDFSNPIQADSDDELGQLAAAFDDMQRQLARLDFARKQFIAIASHELRTPIFSLGGFLELLEDEDLDEETRRQFIAQVRGQVERLRRLATELLDLSRLEAGSLELRPEPTDVGALARDVSQEFTPALSRKGSRLDLRLAHEPLEVDCDPERVAQVMRILIDNALVHTPAGTPIEVSAGRHNGTVRLQVRDAGLGIKRQTMPHIFEPFFTSDDAQGAGLGLAIARELAERMRGRLAVESAPGSTTFALVLPG